MSVPFVITLIKQAIPAALELRSNLDIQEMQTPFRSSKELIVKH